MNYRYIITFVNRITLALCLLEIYEWGQSNTRFSISTKDNTFCIKTSSSRIVDIVTETFQKADYRIEKKI